MLIFPGHPGANYKSALHTSKAGEAGTGNQQLLATTTMTTKINFS